MKNKKVFLSEKKLIQKFFSNKNIKRIDVLDYFYESRKKIILFVPGQHLEKVFKEMCNAGAGIIGNYTNCSFRTSGTGTYMPTKRARPFAGKKGKLEYTNEIKLELECDKSSLNIVVDAMLNSHPYEEVAYEIYDFTKRINKTNGACIHFKKSISNNDLISKINPLLKTEKILNERINKIAVFNREFEEEDIKRLKELKIKTSLFQSGKNIKIVKT